MPQVSYPFDDTGVASSNLIQSELHTINATSDPLYRVIVPIYAPVYTNNLVVKHRAQDGTTTTLVENQDYLLVFQYLAATRSLGQPVYGGILISNSLLDGNFEITYQTIGGEWVANASEVLYRLVELGYNPRQVAWDQITNVQDLFPPELHPQPAQDVTTYQDLINAVANVANTLATAEPSISAVQVHEQRIDNPHHVTKEQVGLGNLINYPVATAQEVADKLEIDKYVTLKQVVQLLLREYAVNGPTEITRGAEYTYHVETRQIPDGYLLWWEIQDITTTAYDFKSRQGTIIINQGSGDIVINPIGQTPNFAPEFKLILRTDGVNGPVVAKTNPIRLLTLLESKLPPSAYVVDQFDSLFNAHSFISGGGLLCETLGTDISYASKDNVIDLAQIDDTAFNLIDGLILPCTNMTIYGTDCENLPYLQDLDITIVYDSSELYAFDSHIHLCSAVMFGYGYIDNYFGGTYNGL